jgi:hypothetical protein
MRWETEKGKSMQLYLLDITFEKQDQPSVETWLSQSNLKGGVLSIEQYDDQVLALLASQHVLIKETMQIEPYTTITFGPVRRSVVYRMISTRDVTVTELIRTFPLQIDEEWYVSDAHTAYLCLPSHMFTDKQLSWLAACPSIVSWDAVFEIPAIQRQGLYIYR